MSLLVLRVTNQRTKAVGDVSVEPRFAVMGQKGPVYPAATNGPKEKLWFCLCQVFTFSGSEAFK